MKLRQQCIEPNVIIVTWDGFVGLLVRRHYILNFGREKNKEIKIGLA